MNVQEENTMGRLEQRAGLTGRKAVVIGGGGGIGAAATLALGESGVDVAFCDIDAAASELTLAALRGMGRRGLSVRADATDSAALADFYAQAKAFFGAQLDIVVNVVGGVTMQPFMERTPAECAADIQRNFGYVIESVRHAVPLMGKGGSIINFTTIEAHRGAGGFAVYAGAKAATTNFSKAMAWELGPKGIRINVIAPDTTHSAGNVNAIQEPHASWNAPVPQELWAQAMAMYIPLQVPPSVDQLADAVLFLASDLSSATTGQVLHVDGGTAAALGMLRWPLDGGATLPVPPGRTTTKLFG